MNVALSNEPRHRIFAYAKTKAQISFAVTSKLISAFVFAIRIAQKNLRPLLQPLGVICLFE